MKTFIMYKMDILVIGIVLASSFIYADAELSPPAVVCTGPNEVVTNCYTPCQRNCSNRIIGDDRVCHTACIETGCVCAEGHLRHDNGTCVPIFECSPAKCNPNEVYSNCGTSCPTTCENKDDTNRACILVCVDGCFCANNLIRGPDGTCIPRDQCPRPKCDGPNEKFEACPPNCPHQNCSAIWSRIDCRNASTECRPQCRCIDGYYRNDAGICISTQECINGPNQECPPNSSWQEEASPCPLTCANPLGGICQGKVQPGCVCLPGYLRDESNNCINAEDCPPSDNCTKDERFETCGTACPATCKNPFPRVCTLNCVRGCFCNPGLIRNEKTGKCIAPKDCPRTTCPKNEVWKKCGLSCERTCNNPNNTVCKAACVNGCVCGKGLVRDELTRKCVPIDKCPRKCKKNEVFSSCKIKCPPQTCASIYTLYRCVENITCEPGCDCAKGYLRNGTVDDDCIPSKECPLPKPICGDNEKYYECKPCLRSCETKDQEIVCPAICEPGCSCSDKYIRRVPNGPCILPSECPTCGKNEKFYNCKPCTKTCKNRNKNISCTDICTPGCDCLNNYVRLSKGACVLPSQCPAKTPYNGEQPIPVEPQPVEPPVPVKES